MSKFSTEIGLLLLIFFIGTRCLAWTTVYTTAGSVLQLNIIDLEESIHCDFLSEEHKFRKRIVNTSREYDTEKYQLITSEKPTVTIHAPQKIGSFSKGLNIFELERKTLHVTDRFLSSDDETNGKEGSPIDLIFTLNTTQPLSDQSLRLEKVAFKYFFQFKLQITNASTEDDGVYKCLVVTPWIDIVVAPIRFMYQTDDNIIYGQENKAMNISCETMSGHKHNTLYIKHNGTTLSSSESETVTFNFIPDRHDNSKEYECMGEQVFVRVKLLVNYAPDVQVVARRDSLDCFATGFPQTYIFNKWEHQSEQGEHIRFLNGLHNGTLNLEMLKLKYQISGRYICSVSNGIPNVNGSLFQIGFKNLLFTGKPIFASENSKVKIVQLYKPITLTFLLHSDPIVEKVWITCVAADYVNNETIHDFRLSVTDLTYTEFEQEGKIKGYQISFDFKMFSNDYKKYNIWASNARGKDSFTFKIRNLGEPKFAPENRNIKHGEFGKPLVLAFVLYSNPIMEDIWIEGAITWNNHVKTTDIFKISNKTLSYTVFGNNGNISGYEIRFDKNILRRNDFHEYYLLAKNALGVDFYRFEIIEIDCFEINRKDSIQFITICCIASVLLVYIIVVHICASVKQRSLRSTQHNTPEEIHNHTYDEIGSISYQAVNIIPLTADHQGVTQQTRIVRNSQTAFSLTDINNQLQLNDRTEPISRLSIQEFSGNVMQQTDLSEETINVSSASSARDLRQSDRRYGEGADISSDSLLQSFQSRHNEDEHASINNRSSTSSSDSEGSKIDVLTTTPIYVDDGYENPYQIIMQEIQDTHQYSSILHSAEQLDVGDDLHL